MDAGPAAAHVVLRELRDTWPELVPDGSGPAELFDALAAISDAKESGFVFVIDEWDCIMREAREDDAAQRAYLDFLRNLLKGRPYVDACYMTGILPIKKCGQHGALNLFVEYSMTEPRGSPHLFGFNADEVERLCARFGMDFAEMSRWYDGYQLGRGRIHVFNPRSVAGAISDNYCASYWTRTETYEALQAYLDMDFDGVATELVEMLDGQKVPADVENFENDMVTFRGKDDVYALLVHLGYLGYDQVERAVFIPNEEIRREFASALKTGARPLLARLVAESRELQRRTLEGDEAYVADAMDRAHSSAAAPVHYDNEQALRAAVKLAYIWSIDDYLRVDELPGGKGYADLVFVPRPQRPLPPLVVELKWDRPADAALAQIRRRDYPQALAALSGECVLVGVTYDADTKEHTCQIEHIEL